MEPIRPPGFDRATLVIHSTPGGLWWVSCCIGDDGWQLFGPVQSSRERAIEAWNEWIGPMHRQNSFASVAAITMKEVSMTPIAGELIAWVVAGILGTLGASAAFVAWVFRTFLFDRIEKLEEKLSAVEKNGMIALATAVESLRLEVAKQGEHLSSSIDATRREIKDDVAMLMSRGVPTRGMK